MDRAAAALHVQQRFGAYLEAAERGATDAPGALGEVIDDALRALAVSPSEPEDAGEDDLRLMVEYKALLQLVRDLGTNFDYSDPDMSLRLSQVRAAAEKDLERTEKHVLSRFGVLFMTDATNPFITIDTNYLVDAATGDEWAG